MTDNFYQKKHEYYFNNLDNEIIKENLKEIFKSKKLKECILYLKDGVNNINSLELLYNINYHSILWEYLNTTSYGMTNGIYQEFKRILFKNVTKWSYNKLNNLMLFNELMTYIILLIRSLENKTIIVK